MTRIVYKEKNKSIQYHQVVQLLSRLQLLQPHGLYVACQASSVHGILQARILASVAISFSKYHQGIVYRPGPHIPMQLIDSSHASH